MNRFMKFLREEDGATAIEYALIAALIAVAIALALSPVGTELTRIFGIIRDKLAAVAP